MRSAMHRRLAAAEFPRRRRVTAQGGCLLRLHLHALFKVPDSLGRDLLFSGESNPINPLSVLPSWLSGFFFMAPIAIAFGTLLVVLGGGLFGLSDPEKRSYTAFIPSGFGILLIIAGIVARD